MGSIVLNKISPMTNYYIRKLYQQKDPYLLRVEDLGDDFSAFLDLDQTLKTLYPSDQISTIIRQLEVLVQYHQTLAAQSPSNPTQLKDLEQRIFAMLGETNTSAHQPGAINSAPSLPTKDPTVSPITVEQLLSILKDLYNYGATYLGDTITTNYMIACRPDLDWFGQFQVERARTIVYTGSLAETLDSTQLQGAQQWIIAFIDRCSQVISLFPQMVNRTQLLNQLHFVESSATSNSLRSGMQRSTKRA